MRVLKSSFITKEFPNILFFFHLDSTGLTFNSNLDGDVFLQETSQKGLAFNIDRVYYIEIFSFKNAKTPNMKLTVEEDEMQSDHRNLFDFGFR